MFSSRKSGTFIARLRELLKDEEMLQILRNNEGSSRLFDGLPDRFDVIFEDTNVDADQLGKLLSRIREANIDVTEGHVFIREADKALVRNWAKRIMARISTELLDEKNNIDPGFLELIGKSPQTLSNRSLICAYFSIANQYMIKKMMESDAAKIINRDVMRAFMQFMSQYPKWVDSVLKERLLTVKPSYLDDFTPISADDANFDVRLGIGGALFGLFVLGGIAAYSAYQSSKKNNNESQRAEEESVEEQPPNQSPYSDWTYMH